MDLADKILPNLLLIGNSLDLTENSMMVGHSEGQFHLVSFTRQGNNIVQESIVVQEGWEAFLRRVADEMGDVFVPTADMLDLEGLERTSPSTDSERELIRRAKDCLQDLNKITSILRSGYSIGSEFTINQYPMTGWHLDYTHVSVKFMKEIK